MKVPLKLRTALRQSRKEEAAGKGRRFKSGREAMRWLESGPASTRKSKVRRKRNFADEILQGIREIKRGEYGRVTVVVTFDKRRRRGER